MGKNEFYKICSVAAWIVNFMFLDFLMSMVCDGEWFMGAAIQGGIGEIILALLILVPPSAIPFAMVRLAERGPVGSVLLSLLGMVISVVVGFFWFLAVGIVALLIENPIALGVVSVFLLIGGIMALCSGGAEVFDVFIFRRD